MSYRLTLDPAAVAQGRAELELNSGPIRVGGTSGGGSGSVDFGDAAIAAYLADARWGSAPVDYRVPNRMVTVPLMLGADESSFTDAKLALTRKVALIQREGGWLRRGDVNWYADVVDATLTLPDRWGEAGGIEPDVKLVLECLPDYYGDELTLDAVTGTGQVAAVLQGASAQALVAGDHPGRCRIILTDTSGHDQLGALWGLRSRHYDPARTARLFYEAEALSPLDAAATFAHAGASGGHTIRHNALPAGSWCPVLLTDLLAGAAGLTHQGSYQVIARAYSASATPQLRLMWGVGDVAHPVINPAVALPEADDFYLVDLGAVRLDAPPVGAYRWHGVIQALAANQSDPVEIDCVYLQPLDEYAGKVVAVQGAQTPFGIDALFGAGAGADVTGVGSAVWANPGNIASDDGALAEADSAASHYLQASQFGFAIPAGATISGILAEVKRAGVNMRDNRVRLLKAGAVQATEKADLFTPWPAALTFKGYGGQMDLWGGAWAAADINDPGFGVAIAVTPAGAGSSSAQVDLIRITVYYSTAGSFGVSEDAVCYAEREAELRTEGCFRQDSTGTVEGRVALVSGDLPRLPPSGMEGRAVELFLKPSRGDLAGLPDSALDGFSAQVKLRPCWLFGP